MSFSSAKSMLRRHASIAGYEIMLLDLTEVPAIDFTTSRALEDIIVDTLDSGRKIILVGARNKVEETLKKQKVLRHLNEQEVHQTRIEAFRYAQMLLQKNSGSK
jgi:SulP family sulfate permease